MWAKYKLFSIIVCFIIVSLVFFPMNIDDVSGSGGDHILEGVIYDENENPISGIEIVVTNLDTNEDIFTETDQDGNYYVNFEETTWSIPFRSRIKTIDPPGKDFLDAAIEYSIEENLYTYGGDIYLVESTQQEKRGIYTIPIGTLELYETGSWGSGTQYTYWYPSDYTYVTSDTQKKINPRMTLKLYYWRNDGYQHKYYYYIETTRMYPGGQNSKYDQSADYYFTGYKNASHSITNHVYQNPNAGKYWMETCGGFYIKVYNSVIEKWEFDGDGCGVKGYGALFRVI